MTDTTLTDLIRNYSSENLAKFFRWKSRDFAPIKESINHISEEGFQDIQKLGEIQFSNKDQLLVCSIKVTKDLTERSGKKAQFELAKKILKYYQDLYDGIFVFHDANGNFRFSLIYANYFGTRKSFSNYRRFTYYVSTNLTNKTFSQRMTEANFTSLDGIKEAFSVEKVTKEFYADISNWFDWAIQTVSYPDGARATEKGFEMSVIRLITRMIFVWFMRVKGFISKDLFDQETIRFMIADFDDPDSSSYYKAILQNLFFATLSTEVDKRELRADPGFKNMQRDYGKAGVFRFKSLFFDQATINRLFKDIPFLNGGLFTCLDVRKDPEKGVKEEIFIDGFSDNPKHQAHVPNRLFFGDDSKIDLNDDYGTKGKNYSVRGLIKTFERFNFTIDENTPDDQDVALDPELLGQVFENLLARINPETSVAARKETGSFYTPREIVDFMVDESLLAFFQSYLLRIMPETQHLEPRLRALLSYHSEPPVFSEEETECLIEAIDQIKVLDPACGSGAFPMGMLNKLVYLLSQLDPSNERWKKIQFDKAIAAIERVSTKNNEQAKRERIKEIENAFDRRVDSDYGRKLYLIRNSIFGVDIQPMAVHIAKLRFFISLIVEQKKDGAKAEENFGVLPLPNLETKFVSANSLLHLHNRPSEIVPKPKVDLSDTTKQDIEQIKRKFEIYQDTSNAYMRDQIKTEAIRISHRVNTALRAAPDYTPIEIGKLFDTVKTTEQLKRILPMPDSSSRQMSLVESDKNLIFILKEDLNRIHEQHFSTTNPNKKKELEQQDFQIRQALREELRKQKRDWGADSYKRAALQAAWNPYDQNSVAGFFDPEWMFDIKEGFDIVIGNPPYIQLQKFTSINPELQTAYANSGYQSHTATGDIYCLFYEMGHAVLRWRTGILTYITSNKWMRAGYGKSLRDFFEREVDPLLLIDFAGQRVFTTATVDVNILIFRKSKSDLLTKACTIEENCLNVLGDYIQQNAYNIPFSSSAPWVITSPIEDRIREKIEALGTPLGEWDVKIYRGVLTGYNDAFIVDGNTKDRLIAEDPRSAAILKPLLRGRDIKRYRAEFADLWLISTFPALNLNINNYPAIKRHLLSFGKKLHQVGEEYIDEGGNKVKTRKKTGNKWFETQDQIAYYEDFEKEKIVYSEIVREQQFYYDTHGFYPEATSFFITGDSIKYLISLLNSDFITWAFKKYYAGGGLGGSGFRYKKQFILNLPLIKLNDAEQMPFVQCVNNINNIFNSHITNLHKNSLDQIALVEQKINNLVNSLYGLTSEEVAYLESEK